MYLISGLGNPGSRYRNTRHNIGFRVVRLLAGDLGVRLTRSSFHSRNAKASAEGKEVILQCPMTFMNQSGLAVRACARYYGIEPGNILVVHDDIDLPLGKLRMVKRGGAGGHKGVLSAMHHLGTHEFPRLRVGIGRPRNGETVEDYVLGPFDREEERILEKVLPVAVEGCRLFLSKGIEFAMNAVNGQNLAMNKEVKH